MKDAKKRKAAIRAADKKAVACYNRGKTKANYPHYVAGVTGLKLKMHAEDTLPSSAMSKVVGNYYGSKAGFRKK